MTLLASFKATVPCIEMAVSRAMIYHGEVGAITRVNHTAERTNRVTMKRAVPSGGSAMRVGKVSRNGVAREAGYSVTAYVLHSSG